MDHEEEADRCDDLREPQCTARPGLRRQLDRGELEHHVREHGPEAAANDLSDHVEARVARRDPVERAIDEGHDRVEVRAGDGTEHEDQPDERGSSRGGVLEQLEAGVARREAGGHDAGADDGDQQEARTERFGDETANEVEPE